MVEECTNLRPRNRTHLNILSKRTKQTKLEALGVQKGVEKGFSTRESLLDIVGLRGVFA
jgi:hypothetical protein